MNIYSNKFSILFKFSFFLYFSILPTFITSKYLMSPLTWNRLTRYFLVISQCLNLVLFMLEYSIPIHKIVH